MKSTIDLESGLCRLELSGQDGRINEFSLGGEVLIQSTRQLFALSFRNISGEQIILSSNDFENFEARNIVDGVFMKFSEHPDYDDIKVSVRVKSLGNSFKFHTAVSGQDKRFMLEWFSCPEVVVDGRLKNVNISGDFFSKKEISALYHALNGVLYQFDSLKYALADVGDYIVGSTADEIASLFING